ncbi:hypothetical protein ACOMHN_034898 [Nucella lapillus]
MTRRWTGCTCTASLRKPARSSQIVRADDTVESQLCLTSIEATACTSSFRRGMGTMCEFFTNTTGSKIFPPITISLTSAHFSHQGQQLGTCSKGQFNSRSFSGAVIVSIKSVINSPCLHAGFLTKRHIFTDLVLLTPIPLSSPHFSAVTLSYSLVCNFFLDCGDKSDESLVNTHPAADSSDVGTV